MRFEKILPSPALSSYIKHYVLSENNAATEYKVFPSSGLVVGFQYRGKLLIRKDGDWRPLSAAGITGVMDGVRTFRNSENIGSLLVFFTETGFAHFGRIPPNDLFNYSISLDHIFTPDQVSEAEERLMLAPNDHERIKVVERFLLSQLRHISPDHMVVEAVRLIYQSKGGMRIKELAEKLFISQAAFEKRFRTVVGTSPKKFAAIIRFNAVLADLDGPRSLTELCYDHGFFDQAHFIKNFKQFTGETPERFKNSFPKVK